MDAQQGPRIERTDLPLTLERLADLNKYDRVGRAIDALLANGELSDCDDELANSLRIAKTICQGVLALTKSEQS